jgi:hypothetical protein
MDILESAWLHPKIRQNKSTPDWPREPDVGSWTRGVACKVDAILIEFKYLHIYPNSTLPIEDVFHSNQSERDINRDPKRNIQASVPLD